MCLGNITLWYSSLTISSSLVFFCCDDTQIGKWSCIFDVELYGACMSGLTTAVAQHHFLCLEVQSWPCLFYTFHQVRHKPSSSLLRLTRPPAAVGQHATVVLWIPATCRAMRTRHILLLCILGAALLSSVCCRSKDTSGHLFVVISLFLNWVCVEKLDCLCLQMRSALTTVASTSTRDRWTKDMSAPITWRIVDAPKLQSCE